MEKNQTISWLQDLKDDAVYAAYDNICDLPKEVVMRLKHYFLTYKDHPDDNDGERMVEITHIFQKEEAHEIINRSIEDYQEKFERLGSLLQNV